MTEIEQILIGAVKICSKDKDIVAVLLQDYIAHHGPVSNEAGEFIKEILKKS